MEVLEIVLPVLAMIILGILCRKWKLLDQSGVNNMKTLVTNIMLPVAIFHALATAEYSGKIGILVLIMFVMLLISFGAGFWMKRFMDEPYKKYLPYDFAGQGYQQRMPEGSGQLGIQAVRDAEKIVVLLDEQYYYDEKGYLRSRCSAEKYSSVRKLFHLLNQAKESLALVVRENMAVYEVMMEILQMHRNR